MDAAEDCGREDAAVEASDELEEDCVEDDDDDEYEERVTYCRRRDSVERRRL